MGICSSNSTPYTPNPQAEPKKSVISSNQKENLPKSSSKVSKVVDVSPKDTADKRHQKQINNLLTEYSLRRNDPKWR